MKEFISYLDIPKNFTGICKSINNNSIVHCKNGKYHREDGPAIEYENNHKSWYYKDMLYGYDENFTIETWIEKVKEIKYLESLQIFK